ncbi:ATP-binding protein [Actinoplanes nipponensis]|uniref:ATP-binding protein n=1 Tax=Actinoplanes nipponensis TaxID=135950 RepID=UPI001EF2B8EF|nr:ATP-binding protein [Actinoplanes nipponensis]
MRGRRAGPQDGATGAWQGRFVGPLLAATVLIVGLTATLLTARQLRSDQRESADRVMDQRTSVARAAVAGEAGRYRNLLQAVAAGLGTNPGLTAADFAAATGPLADAGLLGATSVAFVVPARTGDVPRVEAFWRGRGAAGLRLTPSGSHPEHYFAIFQRALNGNGVAATGLDVAPSSEGSAALVESRRTGRPTVSDTYVLLRDRGIPPDRQQLSFVFAAPVYSSVTPRGQVPEFRGWVALGLRGQDFLGGVLSTASQGTLDGELYAVNGDSRRVLVAGYDAPGGRDLTRQATFPVADRHWTLVTAADSRNLPGAYSSMPAIVLAGGLSITLMLACLVCVLATGRSRARAQVLVATAELRTAEAESRRQAGLLGAIMSSLGDGVGVVDESGAFLLHNPAAKALLGVPDDIDGPQGWQEHYGLYRPDGHTPFPVEEMPLVRALRGEKSDGVEMIIRNDRRPDGILVSVDGRPLDANAAGRHGAVAVFHDITELRRYETDLAVFAGVVAHDLKAPLAVIRGHCETASEDLADAPDSAEVAGARAALGRIAGNADRMAALIDTLLAYTTSRDAPLKLGTVPLDPLVAEVIEQRIEPARPGGAPPPDCYVGPLPEVRADPAMLRHVVDNLIGNALKYVPAGRNARIDVTAQPGPPGWTRIEIADRGIGIPDEDKPNIFESFHRARTAAGYAGTGLGLAICRRIVERHGGTIGVADNPGGGTRFHFTLPLATAGEQPAPADRTALERALAERAAAEESTPPSLAADQAGRGGISSATHASN